MAYKTKKETWYTLKEEYEGSDRTHELQVLYLRRESESGKYVDRISLIINNIRLLGDDFPAKRIMEKILVILPERFEFKISSPEKSMDLNTVYLGELMSVLKAQEQRKIYDVGKGY